MRLLIVEDETEISGVLAKALAKHNFAVDLAETGTDGLDKALTNTYDCIILDLNLPGIDGLEVASRLRKKNNSVPILMLTARTNQNNVNAGFETGADDYLKKPFDFKELLYRIEALIKRANSNPEELLSAPTVELNPKTLKVTKSGKAVQLNAKEYGILEYLLRNKGKVVSQEELLEHVWNEEIDMFTQTVRTNIKTLRKKVDPTKAIIKTFKGKGYVIEE
jgi:DNA-binding response OmpR family regulator